MLPPIINRDPGDETQVQSIEHLSTCKPEHMSEPDEEGVRDCFNCGLFEFPVSPDDASAVLSGQHEDSELDDLPNPMDLAV
jgi:hypothetical protein